MVPAVLLFLATPALIALFLALLWWGSNQLFHPPLLLKTLISPSEFDLPFEPVKFRAADDVILRGWMIPAGRPTNRTVMLCHGWGDNKGDVLSRLKFLARDFNLFLFDTRAHGDSGGDITTLGFFETMDFDAALDFLKSRRPEWTKRLGLFGLSMGASIGITGISRRPDFKCAVFESPFRSFNRVVEQFTKNNFAMAPMFLVDLVLILIRWRLGGDPEPTSPVYTLPKISGKPLLFIAAERDALMPLPDVRGLYEAAAGPKELWVVPEAVHGGCQEAAPEDYESRISRFFKENV